MSLSHLLDTNICIAILRDRPSMLLARMNAAAEGLAVSSITAAELWNGVFRSRDPDRAAEGVAGLCARLTVLPFADEDARTYGEIRSHLQANGRIIGPMDLLIAAHARRRNLVLVTNSRREFDRVPDLQVEDWLAG